MAPSWHLQKIIRRALLHAVAGLLLLVRWRVKLQECVLQVLIDLHDCCLVAATVAIVWSREDRYDVSVMAPIIALHDKLVRTRDEFQTICMVELLRNVLAKSVASSSRRDAPTTSVIWIRPEEVTHWSFMRHLLNAIQLSDIIQGVQRRRDATVHADDLILNDCGHWQVIERISEGLPYIWSTVGAYALVEEAIDLCDLPALMVATQQRDTLPIANLEEEHKRHCLD